MESLSRLVEELREAKQIDSSKPKVVQSRPIQSKPTTAQPEESGWLTTKEACELYGEGISQNTFRKLPLEDLRRRFQLEGDLTRRVHGKNDSRWLRRVETSS